MWGWLRESRYIELVVKKGKLELWNMDGSKQKVLFSGKPQFALMALQLIESGPLTLSRVTPLFEVH